MISPNGCPSLAELGFQGVLQLRSPSWHRDSCLEIALRPTKSSPEPSFAAPKLPSKLVHSTSKKAT